MFVFANDQGVVFLRDIKSRKPGVDRCEPKSRVHALRLDICGFKNESFQFIPGDGQAGGQFNQKRVFRADLVPHPLVGDVVQENSIFFKKKWDDLKVVRIPSLNRTRLTEDPAQEEISR